MSKGISEFDYIKSFAAMFSENLPPGVRGIGDDCAVVPYNENESLLISTDTLIDTVHYLSDRMSACDIAYKSLAVNLSDIAAMGGQPLYVLLALGVNKNVEKGWLDEFFAGLNIACREYKVALIGGDTTSTPDKTVISITIIGKAENTKIKYRSAAQTGDLICVTGVIGDSVGGLACFLNEQNGSQEYIDKLKSAHLRPRPHLREGEWLSSWENVGAMIDISDGIESDIQRISDSSQCGAEIELSSLPLSQEFSLIADQNGWDKYEMAVSGGEDYCLMLTVAPESFNKIAADYFAEFHTPLTAIGRILDRKDGFIWRYKGNVINLKRKGYDHFR